MEICRREALSWVKLSAVTHTASPFQLLGSDFYPLWLPFPPLMVVFLCLLVGEDAEAEKSKSWVLAGAISAWQITPQSFLRPLSALMSSGHVCQWLPASSRPCAGQSGVLAW